MNEIDKKIKNIKNRITEESFQKNSVFDVVGKINIILDFVISKKNKINTINHSKFIETQTVFTFL